MVIGDGKSVVMVLDSMLLDVVYVRKRERGKEVDKVLEHVAAVKHN